MSSDYFSIIILITSILAASIAAVSGFGIGSILTPLLGIELDLKVAVAAISIPHLTATVLRFWMLKEHVNKPVFIKFGILSAIGGLLGALFHTQANNPILTALFAGILISTGISGLSGWSQKLKIAQQWSGLAGLASGTLGGLVGNQGGIRSAALLSFDLPKNELVATATAIGIIVDLARLPVYFISEGTALLDAWWLITVATLGCVFGTLLGKGLLSKLKDQVFRRAIYSLILLLGIYMVAVVLQRK